MRSKLLFALVAFATGAGAGWVASAPPRGPNTPAADYPVAVDVMNTRTQELIDIEGISASERERPETKITIRDAATVAEERPRYRVDVRYHSGAVHTLYGAAR